MLGAANAYAQGIGNIANSYTAYQEQKDKDKQALAAVKGTEAFLKTNAPLLGIDQSTLDQMLAVNPKESPMERHARIGQFVAQTLQAPAIAKTQAETAKAKADADQATKAAQFHEMQANAMRDELNRKNQQLDYLKTIGQFSKGVGTGVLAPGVQDKMNADIANNPFLKTAANAVAATGEIPNSATLINDDSRAAIAAANNEARLAKLEAANAAKMAGTLSPGYRWKGGVIGGEQEIIPGSKAEIDAAEANQKLQSEADKRTKEAQNDALRVKSAQATLDSALANVDNALKLSKQGAGGPWDSYVSKVPIAGAALTNQYNSSRELQSMIDSIKAALKVENIKELKSLSASGATGFGQLSDKEGSALEDNIAKLDPTQRESFLQERLKTIREHLLKMRGTQDEKAAAQIGGSVSAPGYIKVGPFKVYSK